MKKKSLKVKKKNRPLPRAKKLKPFIIGGGLMARHKKHGKKSGYKVTHRVSRMSGEFGRCGVGLEGMGRTAFSTLGNIALALFGAVAASFVANKIPATWSASRHLKVFTPAVLGLAAVRFLPAKYRHTIFPAACGAYAVSGVTAVKTYLPGVPLLAGDAAALEVPQYSMGTDAEGRLIDTRDGSLLLDDQGRTLKGDGTPHEENIDGETSMIDGEPGEMLGDTSMLEGAPGEMLGEYEPEEMLS
jgi:hypothetical protein